MCFCKLAQKNSRTAKLHMFPSGFSAAIADLTPHFSGVSLEICFLKCAQPCIHLKSLWPNEPICFPSGILIAKVLHHVFCCRYMLKSDFWSCIIYLAPKLLGLPSAVSRRTPISSGTAQYEIFLRKTIARKGLKTPAPQRSPPSVIFKGLWVKCEKWFRNWFEWLGWWFGVVRGGSGWFGWWFAVVRVVVRGGSGWFGWWFGVVRVVFSSPVCRFWAHDHKNAQNGCFTGIFSQFRAICSNSGEIRPENTAPARDSTEPESPNGIL